MKGTLVPVMALFCNKIYAFANLSESLLSALEDESNRDLTKVGVYLTSGQLVNDFDSSVTPRHLYASLKTETINAWTKTKIFQLIHGKNILSPLSDEKLKFTESILLVPMNLSTLLEDVNFEKFLDHDHYTSKYVNPNSSIDYYTDYFKFYLAANQNGSVLAHAPPIFQADKDLVLAAVTNCCRAIRYASEILKDDEQVILAAISHSGLAFNLASKRLKGSREFVLKAVQLNGMALQFASDNLQDDKEIAIKAIQQNDEAIDFVSDRLHRQRRQLRAEAKQRHNSSYMVTVDGKERETRVVASQRQDYSLVNSAGTTLDSPSPSDSSECLLEGIFQCLADFINEACE